MEPTELHDRISNESDDTLELHAAYQTGNDHEFTYFVVIGRKTHESKEMLKIRYFAIHNHDPAKDTWMKNGITARHGDDLVDSFPGAFSAIAKGYTGDDGDFITKNLTDQ